ncbi:MAG: hypothetical protein [Caudoviricetes sp.]|nr:MAG: hypothetical protein [Caudoviricetes sp.]
MVCTVWESSLEGYLDSVPCEATENVCLACNYKQGIIRTIVKGVVKLIGKIIDFFLITIIKNLVCFISTIIKVIFNVLTAPIRWFCRFKKALRECLCDYPLIRCIIKAILFIPYIILKAIHRFFCFLKWLFIRVPLYLLKKLFEDILEILGCIPLIGCWLKEQGVGLILFLLLLFTILAFLLFKYTIGLLITIILTIILTIVILIFFGLVVFEAFAVAFVLFVFNFFSFIPIIGPLFFFIVIIIGFGLLIFTIIAGGIYIAIILIIILIIWIVWGVTGI